MDECCFFACFFNFNQSNTPPLVFFTFFKLYKWYQIPQRITFVLLKSYIKELYYHNKQLYFVNSDSWSNCVQLVYMIAARKLQSFRGSSKFYGTTKNIY